MKNTSILFYCALIASLAFMSCKDQINTPQVETNDERIVYTTLDFSNRDAIPNVVSADSAGMNPKILGPGYAFGVSSKRVLWTTGDSTSKSPSFVISDKNGGNARTLDLSTPNGRVQDMYGYAISPDGSMILFYSHDTTADRDNLYLCNSDGSGRRLITNSFDHQTHPCFSPDGKQIAYYRNFDDAHNLKKTIEIASVDGSSHFMLTGITDAMVDGAGSIVWSAKNMICYVDNDSIFLIKSDGTGKHVVDLGYTPAWSPTGDTLAISMGDIELLTSSGTVIANITNTSGVAEAYPQWSSDGKHLLVTRWIGDFDNTMLSLEEVTLPDMTTKLIASPGGFGYYVR
ncbi:MAG: hypothetical protein Q8896_08800 [Bacteroidota bacterium]|nr:hypothetical protein [Bacteroidota bacterium]